MSEFTATAQEQQLIKTVLAKADTQDLGVVTGDEAVKVFAGSGLSPTILGEIWQLADVHNNGFLTDSGLGIALRLIGWAQAGENPKKELVARGVLRVVRRIMLLTRLRSRPAPHHQGHSHSWRELKSGLAHATFAPAITPGASGDAAAYARGSAKVPAHVLPERPRQRPSQRSVRVFSSFSALILFQVTRPATSSLNQNFLPTSSDRFG